MNRLRGGDRLKSYGILLALFAGVCTIGPLWGQETSQTKKLYDFEPASASGAKGLTYRRSYFTYFGATYLGAANPTQFVGWDYRYFGYMELDPTQGAKGTQGSLKLTVTGGNSDGSLTGKILGCGGPITSREDLQEHPDRLCKGSTNQSFFHWYIHGRPGLHGRSSFPQAIGSNRLSFYIKLPKVFDQSIGAHVREAGSEQYNFHVGTYPINPATQASQPRNEDTHYYHWVALNGGGWIHVLVDPHPQHERDQNGDPGLNPTKRRWGYQYFDGLSAFYIGDVNFTSRPIPWSVNVDEVEFYNTADTPEPNQNDETIATVAVGYYPDDGHWEINWYDPYRCDYCMATYELRYATEPITNANFDKALPVPVERYGPDSLGKSKAGLVRKQGPWSPHIWTRFVLPANLMQHHKKIYFAIKDISKKGGHCKGENWENARCDNRDASDHRIHTIDYQFGDGSSGVKP